MNVTITQSQTSTSNTNNKRPCKSKKCPRRSQQNQAQKDQNTTENRQIRTSYITTNEEGSTVYRSNQILPGWSDIAMMSFKESILVQDGQNENKDTEILKTQCKKLENLLEYLIGQEPASDEACFDIDTYNEVKDAILTDFDEEDGPKTQEPKQTNPFEAKKIEQLKESVTALENELSYLEAYEEIVAQELGADAPEEEEEGQTVNIDAGGISANIGGVNLSLGGNGGDKGGMVQAKVGGMNIGLSSDGKVGISGGF